MRDSTASGLTDYICISEPKTTKPISITMDRSLEGKKESFSYDQDMNKPFHSHGYLAFHFISRGFYGLLIKLNFQLLSLVDLVSSASLLALTLSDSRYEDATDQEVTESEQQDGE